MYVYVKIGLAPDSSVPVCGGHKVSPCLMLALVGRVAMAVAKCGVLGVPMRVL